MTPAEIKQTVQDVVDGLNTAGSVASVFVPQYAALIAIGQAVDKLIPGIAAQVASWIEGNPPTEDELAEFAQRLSVLGDPDLP